MPEQVQHATPHNIAPSETENQQSAYTVLVGLVQDLDTHILAAQRFHVALLSGTAPALAYFSFIRADWQIIVSLTMLGFILALHWASMATRLTLQKLCWTRALRALESQLFPAGQGPFTLQKVFFEELAAQNIGWFERLLMCSKISKPQKVSAHVAESSAS